MVGAMMSKTHGMGVGKGHGGNTDNLPKIREVEKPPYWSVPMQPGTKVFRMGKATIFISPPFEEAHTGWHLSISRQDRYPSWDEIAKARYELLPNDLVVVMVLPSSEDYINIHNYCFQLHELLDESAI